MAEWTKALDSKSSRRVKACLVGSNPTLSAIHHHVKLEWVPVGSATPFLLLRPAPVSQSVIIAAASSVLVDGEVPVLTDLVRFLYTPKRAGSQGSALRSVRVGRIIDLAVLDGEVAVPCNPQSATAGLNSRLRPSFCGVRPVQVAKRAGSCATGTREPRQAREGAAVSGHFRVPQGYLVGAGYSGTARRKRSGAGARPGKGEPETPAPFLVCARRSRWARRRKT